MHPNGDGEAIDESPSKNVRQNLLAMRTEPLKREEQNKPFRQQLVTLAFKDGEENNSEPFALPQAMIGALQRQLANQQARFNEMNPQI